MTIFTMVCVKQIFFQRSQSFALLIRPSKKVMDDSASGVFQEHEVDPRNTTEKLPSISSGEGVILGCTKNSAENHCGFSNPEGFKTRTSLWSSENLQKEPRHASNSISHGSVQLQACKVAR